MTVAQGVKPGTPEAAKKAGDLQTASSVYGLGYYGLGYGYGGKPAPTISIKPTFCYYAGVINVQDTALDTATVMATLTSAMAMVMATHTTVDLATTVKR